MFDAQSLTALIDRHSAALVLYARQWCGDPEDAVQEALVELTQLNQSPVDPVAWLFTTTKRRAINQTRSVIRRRKRESVAREGVNGQALDQKNNLNQTTWFESDIENQEEIEKLQHSLEQLAPIQREIVVAHIWGELTFEQIAKLVDQSSSACHRDYHSALARLRRAWDDKPIRIKPLL